MITVSDKAKIQLDKLRTEEGFTPNAFLRVGVEGGGCSGLSYKLNFDENFKQGDQIFNDKEFQIVVDVKSFLYLAGTELDFSDGLNGKGFEFKNPNASRTCACGERLCSLNSFIKSRFKNKKTIDTRVNLIN